MRKTTLISEKIIKNCYIRRVELVNGNEFSCDDYEITSSYTLNGDLIGDTNVAEMLCIKYGIHPEKKSSEINMCTIGFCESEQKWYGWSHRAIFGFGIGHTVEPGDCNYIPSTVDELYVKHCQRYGTDKIVKDDKITYVNSEPQTVCDYENNCIIIEHKYVKKQRIENESELECEPDIPHAVTVEGYEEIYGEEGIHYEWVNAQSEFQHVYTGRGEWTAKTLNDARQMAIDFADGVS